MRKAQTKKLRLGKETIAILEAVELNEVVGGASTTSGNLTCYTFRCPAYD